MAKKKSTQKRQASAREQLQEMQQIAEMSADDRVKLYRKQEQEISQLQEQLKATNAKLKQSEEDNAASEERCNLLLATSPQVNQRAYKRIKDARSTSVPILCFCDWHSEELVDGTTINYFNHFNLDIAKARIERSFRKMVELIEFSRSITDINEAVVWLGGDLITGYIHEELMESNFLSPPEAILWIQERVMEGLNYLKKEAGLKHIHVVTNHGNHGRTTPKRRIKTSHKNSFEWMAYMQIAKAFESDTMFSFNVAKGIQAYEEIAGHVVRFQHGDALHYQGGVGGITIPVMKAIAQWDKGRRADLDIFGHWHQHMAHWKFVSCGCLIGYTDFSLNIKADYQPPTQTFVLMNPKVGRAMALPVFCEPKAGYVMA